MRKILLILSFFVGVESISQTPMYKLLRGKRTLLYDTFTDANGTNIGAHPLDIGGSWTAQNNGLCGSVSSMAIQSNQVQPNAGFLTMYTANATVSSYTVSLNIIIPAQANYLAGVNFRFSDCANYWGVFIERDASGTPYMAIMDSNAGTRTYRATVNVPGATSSTITIKVTLAGDLITALVVGTGETCNYTSSFLNSSTLVGLLGYDGAAYTPAIPMDVLLATN